MCGYYRVLTVVYNAQRYWVFGLCPSSGFEITKRKHGVSEIESVSVLRWTNTSTLLGPLERAILNHWSFTWGRKQIQFPKRCVFLSYFESGRWTKSENPVSLCINMCVHMAPTADVFVPCNSEEGGTQWPRGLRRDLSSPARTLGSCVRIPLVAWTSVCVYSMLVLFCVSVEALRRADPRPRILTDYVQIGKLKKRPKPSKGFYCYNRMKFRKGG
jgi:hypothetical protein